MSVFIVEENKKKPRTCKVKIYCTCGNTFETEMYDISEHGSVVTECQNCKRRYGAKYEGWTIKQLEKNKR